MSARLRRARNVVPGAAVIYPPYSTARYWVVRRMSESGRFAMIDRGAGLAYTSFWAPAACLKERRK